MREHTSITPDMAALSQMFTHLILTTTRGQGGSAQQGFPREGRDCTQHNLRAPRHFQLLL